MAGGVAAVGEAHPVSVRDLTRRFGDFTAVDAVTFDVLQGEIFAFLGPNGAGKTTTIKMLTGLLAPTEGEGRVAGWDVHRERRRIKHSIGYMSQKFSLYGDLTVDVTQDFFRLSHKWMIGVSLKTARSAAHLLGVGRISRGTNSPS